jgi:pilus assembly protein Flp/PilA
MIGRIRSTNLKTFFGRFARDERGATAIEYGLIVSLIFLAITAAVNGYTEETKNLYSDIQSALVN